MRVVLAVLVTTIIGTSAYAQRIVADAIACSACTIDFDLVVRLGSVDGPGAITSTPIRAHRDRRGNFIVVQSDGEPVKVFGPTGAFLLNIGREGSGPGEYRGVTNAIPIDGDSTVLFDVGLGRATVFDKNFRAVRSVRLPASLGSAVLIDWPRVVANGSAMTSEAIGLPLHLLDLSASAVRMLESFGSNGELRPGDGVRLLRRLAPSAGDVVWSAPVLEYLIEEWGTDGSWHRSWRRSPEWFDGVSSGSSGLPNRPPPPHLTALDVDGRGRVWTFVAVASPHWKAAWKDVVIPASGELRQSKGPSPANLFQTMVEVIDTATDSVVTRTKWERVVVATLHDGTVATYTVDADGYPYVEIWKVRLREPEG
ncbi:MAG: hypothetical protein ACE5HT_16485, partial [Gemmatimonadales bacterium]